MSTSGLARRAFLRSATAVTAASTFAAPSISANDRISTAFIGVGVMGSENLSAAMNQPVVALSGKYWLQDDSEIPDTMQATFEYSGFPRSREHRSNNTDQTTSRLMGINFHGSRGTRYVDRALIRVTPEKGSDLLPFEMKPCVRSSIASILGTLSLRAGMRLDWDDKRQTVEQEAARPMLNREYRSPWRLQA